MFGGDITQYDCNANMTEQTSACCAPVSTTAECAERDHRYVQAIAAIQTAAQATQDDLRNLLAEHGIGQPFACLPRRPVLSAFGRSLSQDNTAWAPPSPSRAAPHGVGSPVWVWVRVYIINHRTLSLINPTSAHASNQRCIEFGVKIG